MFACIDTDGDGVTTQDELITHLTSSGYKVEAVSKIFEKLDVDGNGELSKDELRKGMVNYTPLRKAPGFGNYNAEFKDEIHADADSLFGNAPSVVEHMSTGLPLAPFLDTKREPLLFRYARHRT